MGGGVPLLATVATQAHARGCENRSVQSRGAEGDVPKAMNCLEIPLVYSADLVPAFPQFLGQ